MGSFSDDEKPPSPSAGAGSKQGLVTMKIAAYSKKEVALAADTVTAVVEINTRSSAAVREGLDLVMVVDVSGSMGGHKMESLKKALQFVIMKLTPLDRLSIVTFHGTATRLNPLRSMIEAAQSDLKVIVGRLVANSNGETNIKDGLDMGLAILGSRVHTESRIPNIFLMCDRCLDEPTFGGPRQVDLGEVAVHAFGFGAGADQQLLTDLAKISTGGTYNMVPHADGTNLSAPLSLLLGGLLTVVARDVRLTLMPKTADGDLDKMTVAAGLDYTTDPSTGTITIEFGALFSGEARKVAVDLTLKDMSAEADEYDATLAVAGYSYAAEETRQSPENIRRRRTRNPISLTKEPSVHADIISDATKLADKENLDEARERIRDAQNAIEDMMLDDGEKMANVLNAELEQLLTCMQSQALYNHLGRPYALATITSHGRQRAAARGDEDKIVSLYATPRMITCLDQAKRFEENREKPVPTADHDVEQEMIRDPLA